MATVDLSKLVSAASVAKPGWKSSETQLLAAVTAVLVAQGTGQIEPPYYALDNILPWLVAYAGIRMLAKVGMAYVASRTATAAPEPVEEVGR